MNKRKLNRYGKAVGISVISVQTFRERPKKHGLSAEMSKLMERKIDKNDKDRSCSNVQKWVQ